MKCTLHKGLCRLCVCVECHVLLNSYRPHPYTFKNENNKRLSKFLFWEQLLQSSSLLRCVFRVVSKGLPERIREDNC